MEIIMGTLVAVLIGRLVHLYFLRKKVEDKLTINLLSW